jgi:hypothetical protein
MQFLEAMNGGVRPEWLTTMTFGRNKGLYATWYATSHPKVTADRWFLLPYCYGAEVERRPLSRMVLLGSTDFRTAITFQHRIAHILIYFYETLPLVGSGLCPLLTSKHQSKSLERYTAPPDFRKHCSQKSIPAPQ